MRKKSCIYLSMSVIIIGLILGAGACPPVEPQIPIQIPTHLAIASGNRLLIFDTGTRQILKEISRYQESIRIAYRPDGQRLAVGVCYGDRIVELDTENYDELNEVMDGDSCPWAFVYSPDNEALAATIPKRDDPSGFLFGRLMVVKGNQQLADKKLGSPLPAVVYRPGGGEIAVAIPGKVKIFSTQSGFPEIKTVPGLQAVSMKYTIDGSRLIVGTTTGCTILNAADGYSQNTYTDTGGKVIRAAVDPTGGWVALMRSDSVSVLRVPDFYEVAVLQTNNQLSDIEFSPDGSQLAVAEKNNRVLFYQVFTWEQIDSIPVTGRVDRIAFKPLPNQRIPVLFVHGRLKGAGAAWFDKPAGTTSFAASLAANPDLPIDAFYLELPLRGSNFQENYRRGIELDAQDILAAIEGGEDSHGALQVGILNMHNYRLPEVKVAIIAYSMGAISSRYYIKHLMGNRRNNNNEITISEFVTLAAPNHGLAIESMKFGDLLEIDVCGNVNEPDRSMRQLCGGLSATSSSLSASCGDCGSHPPVLFNTNLPGDESFLAELNDHPLMDSCNQVQDYNGETPRSRPFEDGGVLYLNLYAAFNLDIFVGGGAPQRIDCLGRRLAKNLGRDAENREIPVAPLWAHSNFPHQWETICMALKTVVNHMVPTSIQEACQEMLRL